MTTGTYYHVVADVMTYNRGNRYETVASNARIVTPFNRNANYSLCGSYKSKNDAQQRADEINATGRLS